MVSKLFVFSRDEKAAETMTNRAQFLQQGFARFNGVVDLNYVFH